MEREIERRNGPGYDAAERLIRDLQIIADEQGRYDAFQRQLDAIRERHVRKPRLIERLEDID